jgi:hypothetical protein
MDCAACAAGNYGIALLILPLSIEPSQISFFSSGYYSISQQVLFSSDHLGSDGLWQAVVSWQQFSNSSRFYWRLPSIYDL